MPATSSDKPTAPTVPQGPTLEDAARRMESLLDLREDNQGLAKDDADQAPADTDEGVAAEAESQETPVSEDAGTDDAEATDADETSEGTSERDRLVTVTVDGKAVQIPLFEALQGYQRQSDYSRKTAALANSQRELEQHYAAVSQERQTYAHMLQSLQQQLQPQLEQEPDWSEVYQADPVGYARRRDEWRDKQEKVVAANFELQRVQSLRQKEFEEYQARMTVENRTKMFDKNPAWKDPKVWEPERRQIIEYLVAEGYSPAEISQAQDPRAIAMANKARKWDALQAGKPQPVIRQGPRVASAGAGHAQGDRPRLNAAQQRLARSGSIEDAAKVFEQLL